LFLSHKITLHLGEKLAYGNKANVAGIVKRQDNYPPQIAPINALVMKINIERL